jgi:uncharacterized membrane protein (GlpM family)
MDAIDDYPVIGGKTAHHTISTQNNSEIDEGSTILAERRLKLKVDLRLCTIAGLLCSLNLLDSGIISSASVTSMLKDLDLTGNRYSVSIWIFTLSSIIFQLPSTILLRFIGPRLFFATITTCFGLITLCTAFITTWRQMIALRVLLGISMSGIYPGLTFLISTWYTRKEQQLRFAFLQSGEVIILVSCSVPSKKCIGVARTQFRSEAPRASRPTKAQKRTKRTGDMFYENRYSQATTDQSSCGHPDTC